VLHNEYPTCAGSQPDILGTLQALGRQFFLHGWSAGTSSNYSAVVARDPLRLLITASGKDKGRLEQADFVVVDESGQCVEAPHAGSRNALHAGAARPSAETLLHVMAAARLGANATLHTHSVWATILSDLYFADGAIEFEGYEMLKGLSGVTTHEHRFRLEIVENSQDIAAMSRAIAPRLTAAEHPIRHGFLIRRHGLYTWGRDLDEARRHIEILEFLLEVRGRELSLGARR
jgi:methylthioribulose-1-phosphate dehydratase